MKFTKQNDGTYLVEADNGVKAGEILQGDDGYYQFWPEPRAGYWPAYAMRAIADKVDEINAPWEAEIQKFMKEEN